MRLRRSRIEFLALTCIFGSDRVLCETCSTYPVLSKLRAAVRLLETLLRSYAPALLYSCGSVRMYFCVYVPSRRQTAGLPYSLTQLHPAIGGRSGRASCPHDHWAASTCTYVYSHRQAVNRMPPPRAHFRNLVLRSATHQHTAERASRLVSTDAQSSPRSGVRAQGDARGMRVSCRFRCMQSRARTRTIIAVVGTKGGVGKTALAGNLGYGLTRHFAMDVTLVDLDSSTGLTRGFKGLQVGTGSSTGSLLQGTVELDECILTGLPNEMNLLPSNEADLLSAEFALQAAGAGAAFRLRDMIRPLEGIVILDTPGKANQVFVNALVAADFALISVNPDADSIHEAGKVLNHIDEVRKYVNTNLEVLGVVRNIYERGTNAADAADALIHEFATERGVRLFRTKIPRDTKHREARLTGELVSARSPLSRVAVAYRSLAEEVALALTGNGAANEGNV